MFVSGLSPNIANFINGFSKFSQTRTVNRALISFSNVCYESTHFKDLFMAIDRDGKRMEWLILF